MKGVKKLFNGTDVICCLSFVVCHSLFGKCSYLPYLLSLDTPPNPVTAFAD
ncbi:MAG: hypothetical protein F6K31_30000 [Symploca sp. SIO2G7]|nr:hypothetical protein [Symploca sp. SIO2G7]